MKEITARRVKAERESMELKKENELLKTKNRSLEEDNEKLMQWGTDPSNRHNRVRVPENVKRIEFYFETVVVQRSPLHAMKCHFLVISEATSGSSK